MKYKVIVKIKPKSKHVEVKKDVAAFSSQLFLLLNISFYFLFHLYIYAPNS